MTPKRKKRRSTRVDLIISLVFHSLIVVGLFYFAARQGMLGKKLKTIAVTMTHKEKPPEKPKEKEQEPKPQPDKTEDAPKVAATAVPPPVNAPPAATEVAPAVAPPAAFATSFEFGGGKIVQSSSNPVAIYKGLVEYALHSKWNRPDGVDDADYVAEVEVAIDVAGRIAGSDWIRGSGNARWDDSVKKAISQTASIGRPPPKGFPEKFLVRFDVQSESGALLQ